MQTQDRQSNPQMMPEQDVSAITRQEALVILELSPESDKEQIEKRYELLVRRYRHATDQVSRDNLARINAAYAVLNPQPMPVAWQTLPGQRLILGKPWAYWKNWFYYTRWTLLAAVAGLAFMVYLIATMVANQPADFKILLVGEYGLVDETLSQDDVFSQFEASVVEVLQPMDPDIKKASLDWIALGYEADGSLKETADVQYQQANLMKALAQLSSEDFDIILLSRGAYANYAAQTDFTDLAPLLERLSERLPADTLDQLQELKAHPAESAQTFISGLDVTALDPLARLSLQGEPLVVTIGPRSQHPDLAAVWLMEWLAP